MDRVLGPTELQPPAFEAKILGRLIFAPPDLMDHAGVVPPPNPPSLEAKTRGQVIFAPD
jgi:hypothetical protein